MTIESNAHDPTRHSRRRARQALPEQVDVAIVGAGLGGLMAGARLAAAGHRVAVFDAHYVAGGCATQFQRRTDAGFFRFDVGLHYVGEVGPGRTITTLLDEVGAEVVWEELDPDGFDELVFPDGRFRVPASLDVYRDRLVDAFPREVRGIDRYVRFLREIDAMGRAQEAARGKMNFGFAWKALTEGRLVARWRNATIAEFLDTCTHDVRLRAILLGQHGDYGLPPSRVSAALHAGLAMHYFRGAFYPRGGGQAVADALADRIEALGGTVHLRRPIAKILVENGRAVGVRTEATPKNDAQDVRARVVISNADLRRTWLDLLGPEHLDAATLAQARGWEMGGAIFMTCVGVRGDLRDLGMRNANYWAFDTWDVERVYRDAGERPPKLHGAYITSGSLKDASPEGHAPEGHHTVEVMTLVGGDASLWGATDDEARSWTYRRDGAYQELKSRLQEELMERLEAVVPGVGARAVLVESATPLSHTRFTRASDGTGYGLAATPAQFLDRRPGYRGPVRGLFQCGASTRAGHGIVGALRSGRNVAGAVRGALAAE